jgi:fructose-bisphosphate aldolase, class II
VGNLHLQTEQLAIIDMKALHAIESVTTVPLVLHGGSGIPSETRKSLARESRIKKFNIGTELRMTFGSTLRATLADNPDEYDRISLLRATVPALRKTAASILNGLA